ncbi:hypothetical protein NECID01_0026 [Nematocida sp. AWRm77]|nr:hypothetical protein NECID01_0026 [Nematocida sp. AWRm77]
MEHCYLKKQNYSQSRKTLAKLAYCTCLVGLLGLSTAWGSLQHNEPALEHRREKPDTHTETSTMRGRGSMCSTSNDSRRGSSTSIGGSMCAMRGSSECSVDTTPNIPTPNIPTAMPMPKKHSFHTLLAELAKHVESICTHEENSRLLCFEEVLQKFGTLDTHLAERLLAETLDTGVEEQTLSEKDALHIHRALSESIGRVKKKYREAPPLLEKYKVLLNNKQAFAGVLEKTWTPLLRSIQNKTKDRPNAFDAFTVQLDGVMKTCNSVLPSILCAVEDTLVYDTVSDPCKKEAVSVFIKSISEIFCTMEHLNTLVNYYFQNNIHHMETLACTPNFYAQAHPPSKEFQVLKDKLCMVQERLLVPKDSASEEERKALDRVGSVCKHIFKEGHLCGLVRMDLFLFGSTPYRTDTEKLEFIKAWMHSCIDKHTSMELGQAGSATAALRKTFRCVMVWLVERYTRIMHILIDVANTPQCLVDSNLEEIDVLVAPLRELSEGEGGELEENVQGEAVLELARGRGLEESCIRAWIKNVFSLSSPEDLSNPRLGTKKSGREAELGMNSGREGESENFWNTYVAEDIFHPVHREKVLALTKTADGISLLVDYIVAYINPKIQDREAELGSASPSPSPSPSDCKDEDEDMDENAYRCRLRRKVELLDKVDELEDKRGLHDYADSFEACTRLVMMCISKRILSNTSRVPTPLSLPTLLPMSLYTEGVAEISMELYNPYGQIPSQYNPRVSVEEFIFRPEKTSEVCAAISSTLSLLETSLDRAKPLLPSLETKVFVFKTEKALLDKKKCALLSISGTEDRKWAIAEIVSRDLTAMIEKYMQHHESAYSTFLGWGEDFKKLAAVLGTTLPINGNNNNNNNSNNNDVDSVVGDDNDNEEDEDEEESSSMLMEDEYNLFYMLTEIHIDILARKIEEYLKEKESFEDLCTPADIESIRKTCKDLKEQALHASLLFRDQQAFPATEEKKSSSKSKCVRSEEFQQKVGGEHAERVVVSKSEKKSSEETGKKDGSCATAQTPIEGMDKKNAESTILQEPAHLCLSTVHDSPSTYAPCKDPVTDKTYQKDLQILFSKSFDKYYKQVGAVGLLLLVSACLYVFLTSRQK